MKSEEKKFHDRSTIDCETIGVITERVCKLHLVHPDNLQQIQMTVTEIVAKIGLRYHLKATIRRFAGKGFSVLHLVKVSSPPRVSF